MSQRERRTNTTQQQRPPPLYLRAKRWRMHSQELGQLPAEPRGEREKFESRLLSPRVAWNLVGQPECMRAICYHLPAGSSSCDIFGSSMAVDAAVFAPALMVVAAG